MTALDYNEQWTTGRVPVYGGTNWPQNSVTPGSTGQYLIDSISGPGVNNNNPPNIPQPTCNVAAVEVVKWDKLGESVAKRVVLEFWSKRTRYTNLMSKGRIPFLRYVYLKPMKISLPRLNALATISLVSVLLAIPVPMLELASLVQSSDTIVVGEVFQVSNIEKTTKNIRGQDMPVDLMQALLRVDRVIKGQVGEVVKVQFLVPKFGMGYKSLTAGSYRIVFLTRSSSVFEFTSPYYPSFPATSAYSGQHNSPLDSVISEMATALEATSTSDNDKKVIIWALRNVKTTISSQALKLAAYDKTSELVRFTAVAALLARGDISVLPLAEHAFAADTNISRDDETRQNLLAAIYEGVRSEQAIPILRRLFNSSDVRVRRVMAMALRNTNSRQVVPDLSRALHDTDSEVRYCAVIGLAEITNQDTWRPLEDDFRSNEDHYLAYWKKWVRDNN